MGKIGLQYFYENYCLIDGKAPTLKDMDKAWFDLFEKAQKQNKKIILLKKGPSPEGINFDKLPEFLKK